MFMLNHIAVHFYLSNLHCYSNLHCLDCLSRQQVKDTDGMHPSGQKNVPNIL